MLYKNSQSTCEVSIIPTLQLRNWGLERLNILPKVTTILNPDEGIQIQDSRPLALKLSIMILRKQLFPTWTSLKLQMSRVVQAGK